MKKLALLTLLIGTMLLPVSCYPFGADGGWDKEEKPPVQTTQTTPTGPTVVTANGTTAAVIIDGFAYNPTILIVNKGTTVTWTNKYPIAHRVVADKNEFVSFNASLSTGLSFSWTFTESGNYTYHCANHPTMNATVVVK